MRKTEDRRTPSMTPWENKETAANAIGEVHDSADATAVTPTRTRRNGDAAVSNTSVYPIPLKKATLHKKSDRASTEVEDRRALEREDAVKTAEPKRIADPPATP